MMDMEKLQANGRGLALLTPLKNYKQPAVLALATTPLLQYHNVVYIHGVVLYGGALEPQKTPILSGLGRHHPDHFKSPTDPSAFAAIILLLRPISCGL